MSLNLALLGARDLSAPLAWQAGQPISGAPIDVLQDAKRMTFGSANDGYPMGMQGEEISGQGQSSDQHLIVLQTEQPMTLPEISLDGVGRESWNPINACAE